MKAKQAINKNYFLVIVLLSIFLLKNMDANTHSNHHILSRTLDALAAVASPIPSTILS
jgi:hypothetical protein